MSDHIRVDESYVKALLGHAAWDKAEVVISEETSNEEVIEEAEEEVVHFCPLCESCLEESVSPELYDEFFVALEEAAAGTEEEEDLEEAAPSTKKELAGAEGVERKKEAQADKARRSAQTSDENDAEDAENASIDKAMGKKKVGHPGGVKGMAAELKAAAKAKAEKRGKDVEDSID